MGIAAWCLTTATIVVHKLVVKRSLHAFYIVCLSAPVSTDFAGHSFLKLREGHPLSDMPFVEGCHTSYPFPFVFSFMQTKGTAHSWPYCRPLHITHKQGAVEIHAQAHACAWPSATPHPNKPLPPPGRPPSYSVLAYCHNMGAEPSTSCMPLVNSVQM